MIYISSSWIKSPDFLFGLRTLSSITRNIELSGGACYKSDMLSGILDIRNELDFNFLVHGYFPPSKNSKYLLNLSDTSAHTRNFISESMKYVYALNIPYYSLHAGFKRSFDVKNSKLENSRGMFKFEDMLINIDWFKSKFPGKKLAVENLYPVNGDIDCGFCIALEEMIKLLEADKSIYFLMDIGHWTYESLVKLSRL